MKTVSAYKVYGNLVIEDVTYIPGDTAEKNKRSSEALLRLYRKAKAYNDGEPMPGNPTSPSSVRRSVTARINENKIAVVGNTTPMGSIPKKKEQ